MKLYKKSPGIYLNIKNLSGSIFSVNLIRNNNKNVKNNQSTGLLL